VFLPPEAALPPLQPDGTPLPGAQSRPLA
jgi:hypothetical protein